MSEETWFAIRSVIVGGALRYSTREELGMTTLKRRSVKLNS